MSRLLVSEWERQDYILGFSWLKSQVAFFLFYCYIHLCRPWLPSNVWWLNKGFSRKYIFWQTFHLDLPLKRLLERAVSNFYKGLYSFSHQCNLTENLMKVTAQRRKQGEVLVLTLCATDLHTVLFSCQQSQNTVVWQCDLLFLKWPFFPYILNPWHPILLCYLLISSLLVSSANVLDEWASDSGFLLSLTSWVAVLLHSLRYNSFICKMG